MANTVWFHTRPQLHGPGLDHDISSPAPLGDEAGAHHEARMLGCMGGCDQGRVQCEPECAEVRAAQDAGAQMDEMAEARGVFGIPLAVIFVVAVLAAIAHVVAGGA